MKRLTPEREREIETYSYPTVETFEISLDLAAEIDVLREEIITLTKKYNKIAGVSC